MTQEVKATSPQKKKLFEWDRSRRLLSMKIKQKEYLCELVEDNTFVVVAERDKPNKNS